MNDDWQDCITADVEVRFWNKVLTGDENECWLWFAEARSGFPPNERGVFRIRNTVVNSHRMAWVIANGRIPLEMHVLHKCDVTLCCNPKHLFLGTHQENMKDAAIKGRVRGARRRFTPEQIAEIRELAKQMGANELAAKYDVAHSTIWQILNYYSYKDVK